MTFSDADRQQMPRALALAARGQGCVEPNPMVGCVIVAGGEVVGEGWHARFSGPHAEVVALEASGERARGAMMYVSLEPCAHHGKTPPCTDAIQSAGIRRVVFAMHDPNRSVDGGGAKTLAEAGIEVAGGLLEEEARELGAPYLKLITTGRPWVIAKWAMTLDGKIATSTGDSKWISGEESCAVVHALRGRVDAIMVGRGTAETDDPLLTARMPEGVSPPRTATRIVLDRTAILSAHSQLAKTAELAPVLVAVGESAESENVARLTQAGCEVVSFPGDNRRDHLAAVLDELGRRQMTNILVEGGSDLLGSLFDAGQIDEFHVFVAPKLIGSADAPSPIAGHGVEKIADALKLASRAIEMLGDDVYIHGRLQRPFL